ncbi:MAG: Phenylalanine--tRNA ligase beta subunit [Candidatus Anoxychlamydiales bacterium]|nr:Phenylalanine--tRNA ligase beta subunit [Candidatus Anoxychlamydiales bacterium]
MRITLSLLKEFLDIKQDPKDIAHLFTSAGIEVDKIENEKPSFTNVFSVKVLDVQKHPKADNLVIAKVTDGNQNFQVVCGAKNCRKDLITAFAKIRATLTDEKGNTFKVNKAKLRDVESFGMLCSANELKLSLEKDQILELDIDFEIGKDLSILADPVFEISLTPNLGHLMSAIGLARELACLTKQKIKMPKLNLKEESKDDIEKLLKVTIEDQRCKRYAARIIENVNIGPSPYWLKRELESCGFRSINNVVDATNYIMLKFNHPMHAFDFDKLENYELKATVNDEEIDFRSLDEIDRKIPKNSLVIKDGKKTVAIAGIIGGLNSSVTNNTKKIVLEAALFDAASIRKTSKLLNLKTQSSIRFEKSIDPNMIPIAIDYLAAFIADIANGKIVKGKIDIKKDKFLENKISIRVKRAQKILGTKISENEMIDIFERLDFKILEKNEDAILVQVPSYRNDISHEIDLIEEIARIYGYNNITKVKPAYRSSNAPTSEEYLFEREIKSYLRSCSLQEIKTCDLISPKLSEIALLNLDKDSLVSVKHFKSIDQSILRATLLPSLLEVVKFNHDHKNFDILSYEISKVHFKNKDEYIERPTLSLIMSGKRNPHLWDKSNFDVNFYDLKGILENVLSAVLDKKYKFSKSNRKGFHPLKQAAISLDNKEFAIIGEVHPNILKSFDIKKRVFFAELDLKFIFQNKIDQIDFHAISELPSSFRDLTLTIDDKLNIQTIFDIFEKIKSKILEKIYLVDLFKNVEDKKNVTFRFIYRDTTKTISNDEIETQHLKITKEITKHLEK